MVKRYLKKIKCVRQQENIDYRLRKLIASGKLEYRGTLRFMRDFDVRLPSDATDLLSGMESDQH